MGINPVNRVVVENNSFWPETTRNSFFTLVDMVW
jgi:hypothetical protein